LAQATVKNRIRSGSGYRVSLRSTEIPSNFDKREPVVGLAMGLKLDFRPPKDIDEMMDIPPQKSDGASQMYIWFSEFDIADIAAYLVNMGLMKSELVQRRIAESKEFFEQEKKNLG